MSPVSSPEFLNAKMQAPSPEAKMMFAILFTFTLNAKFYAPSPELPLTFSFIKLLTEL